MEPNASEGTPRDVGTAPNPPDTIGEAPHVRMAYVHGQADKEKSEDAPGAVDPTVGSTPTAPTADSQTFDTLGTYPTYPSSEVSQA